MTKAVGLSENFVAVAKEYASAANRSLQEQIEHWVKIGRISEDNPELPFSFINDVLLAAEQCRAKRCTRYVRKTKRH